MSADSPQACMTEFAAALIRRDMDAALALLTIDVVLFYSNGTVIRGKEAFAAVMNAAWAVIENYKYSTLESAWLTQPDGATAAVIYSLAWSGVARGQEVGGTGRGTRIFCKAADGGWLLAHEHLSTGAWS